MVRAGAIAVVYLQQVEVTITVVGQHQSHQVKEREKAVHSIGLRCSAASRGMSPKTKLRVAGSPSGRKGARSTGCALVRSAHCRISASLFVILRNHPSPGACRLRRRRTAFEERIRGAGCFCRSKRRATSPEENRFTHNASRVGVPSPGRASLAGPLPSQALVCSACTAWRAPGTPWRAFSCQRS